MENFDYFIKAVHPGYTKDGKSNVGEMIELRVVGASPDNSISLAGLKISYTNSSGNEYVLVEITEDLRMKAAGEVILIRLAGASDGADANLTYTKTLAFKGGLTLYKNEEVVDNVCWTGGEGCEKAFSSSKPTVLVRNEETGEFEHVLEDEYVVEYKVENLVTEASEDNGGLGNEVMPQCRGVEFSEILSYYAETQSEQFVELHNNNAEQVLLDGCMLKYKNKTYPLTGILKADGYVARVATDFTLTKNPTNAGVVELIDVDGEVVDRLEYPNGQRKGTSYALIGYDAEGKELWHTTYAVTAGEPNIYQEYKTCEAGKVINEETGNCVKVTEVEEKTCGEGQYLNPLTGRCKKIETTTASTTVCKEGYYLNEETGRCRKIVENTGANYSVATENYEEASSFVAVAAVAIVAVAGLIYVAFEFRREIAKFFRKVFGRVRK